MPNEKKSHPLTPGQKQAITPLLHQRHAIDAQIGTLLNIAIVDGGLPKSESGWSLNAETMCLEGECQSAPATAPVATNGVANAKHMADN